jgi:hypothetical protein
MGIAGRLMALPFYSTVTGPAAMMLIDPLLGVLVSVRMLVLGR